ncbi:retrovirus-related pol polyprotein from transposon TNT 1-94 [Tanacetum coccineum]
MPNHFTPPPDQLLKEDRDLNKSQRDKEMQKNLALIAEYFKKIYKHTNNNLRNSSNSRNKNVDTTPRYKNDNQTGQFGNQRTMTVAGARETIGSQVVQQTGIQCFNCKEFGHFTKECRKPKRVKDSTHHKEKMLLCKLVEKGVPLQAEQPDWLEDTDKEIDEHELEAHYSYMAKIQKVPTTDSRTDIEPLEQVDRNIIPDSPDMCDNNIQTDQNAKDERAVLANLIVNLKLDVDENKKIQKAIKESKRIIDSRIERVQIYSCEVYTKLLRSFAKLEKHSIPLEQALQQCQEQIKNDTVCKEKASNVFQKEREQYFEIQDLKAQLQDKNIAISELKKLIEKCKGKSVETKFDKPSVVRQPNAQRITKPSVLGKPAPFSDSLERKSFSQTKSSHRTNVSRPQLRSTQMKDKIVQLILFIVDSGCTKHKMGNLKLLCNFFEKYLGTVNFGNDQFAPILSYGDLVQGNITINRVYYVEDLQGNDLLTGNHRSDLYTIFLQEISLSTPICFMAKASPTQAWLWHRRLSHLNFDYIYLLSKKDVVIGLPELKYVKNQLCSSCKVSKAKRSSFKTKAVPSLKGQLNLLHMDLCGPMRVASINRKKYILVIVDDYSRYTWTLFLRSKDETPEVLKDFLTMIQRNLQASVISIRIDRGTEFLNKTLNAFFKEEGIEHQTSTPRTLE